METENENAEAAKHGDSPTAYEDTKGVGPGGESLTEKRPEFSQWWLVAAACCLFVAAAFWLLSYADGAFVAATLGVLAWFFNVRVQLRKKNSHRDTEIKN